MGEGVVEVRPTRMSDATRYLALLTQIDRETRFLLWEPGERTLTLDALRSRLEDPDPSARLLLVAESDGQLVGFLVALRGEVRRLRHRADFTMAVLEEHRGRGIGSRMLEMMEAWAADNGLQRIELTVMAHNRRAIELYERAGYHLEGVKKGAFLVNAHLVDECVMGKLLPGGDAQHEPTEA